jgi:hypothetical protein
LLNERGNVTWWQGWPVLAYDEQDHRPWARWCVLGIHLYLEGSVTNRPGPITFLCIHFLVCRMG